MQVSAKYLMGSAKCFINTFMEHILSWDEHETSSIICFALLLHFTVIWMTDTANIAAVKTIQASEEKLTFCMMLRVR